MALLTYLKLKKIEMNILLHFIMHFAVYAYTVLANAHDVSYFTENCALEL